MSEDEQLEKSDQDPELSASPPGGSHRFRAMQEMFTGMVRSGPSYHPIFDKFEPQHVTQFLKDASDDDAAKHKMRRGNRWFRLAYFGIVVVLFIFLTIYLLPDHSDLYFQLLQGVGIFTAGLAGGYGIRSYQEKQ